MPRTCPDKLSLCFLWSIVSILIVPSYCSNATINIGALLDSDELRRSFFRSVQTINAQYNAERPLRLNGTALLIPNNPVRAAIDICDQLLRVPIHALIINHAQMESQLASAAASYTMAFYRIPIVGTNFRESLFSDKSVHRSFIRAVPPFSHQADIWLKLLLDFEWKTIVTITSADRNGRALLGRLRSLVEDTDITIAKSLEISNSSQIESGLRSLEGVQSRVFLMAVEKNAAETVFQVAQSLGLFSAGHAWIVSERSLSAKNCPIGIIASRLTMSEKSEEIINDMINVIDSAVSSVNQKKVLSSPPNSCQDMSSSWSDGPLLYDAIIKTALPNGLTGRVTFDENGDRVSAEYNLVNIQAAGEQLVIGKCSIGNAQGDNVQCFVEKRRILWPGGVREMPQGYIVATHLKVFTLSEPPFTYVEFGNMTADSCDRVFHGYLCYEKSSNGSLDFPAQSSSSVGQCCWGYSIDLLRQLSRTLNFTFDLYLSIPTGQVPPEKSKNVTVIRQLNGIIGDLVNGEGDLAVAALTITPEHAKYVDFSKPFKYLGITIMEKKQPKTSTLNSFFQPFTDELWVLVMVSLHVVAVCLYLLDRFSPFSRYKLADSDETEDDALNLSSAMWFAWGVLLNSGIGEGTPRSFGGRVLGMVWAGFAMIMVASYTANLAAFLVLDRPQTSLSGVNDARLRNPSENFTFATVRGSAVDLYFRRQIELASMYRLMEKRNYDNSDQAVAAVKSGELQAFIWDSARLEYEAAKDKDCELVTAGELFGRSGYGVALRKDSPWTSKVTLAILGFHENGFMESLDNKYIYMRNDTQCLADDSAPATLGLNNMAGVFILVGMGIAGGVILIIIEIMYKKHEVRKQRELRLQRMAFDRWKRTVERRKKSRQRLLKISRATTNLSVEFLDDSVRKSEECAVREKLL